MNAEQFMKRWPNFKPSEFMCKCGSCGEKTGLRMKPATMDKLQEMRKNLNQPFSISSGYRCPNHSSEKKKPVPGAHASGQAVDIRADGAKALILATTAPAYGFTGIGVNQKGSGRFIHLDDMDNQPNRPRPWIWSY